MRITLLLNEGWYKNLKDFDPTKYTYSYDTSSLVDGDLLDNSISPWVSNIQGLDLSRYRPTAGYGNFGVNKEHYNYAKSVEELPYYRSFGDLLLTPDGKFTPLGEQWAKAVDKLLPENSEARFYNPDNTLRTSWNTRYANIHGEAPRTFNNLRDYVNYIRNDKVLGARHNVFLNRGKRYFYKDNNGIEHWVDPKDIKNYKVSTNPVRSKMENDVLWDDYELTGSNESNTVSAITNKYGADLLLDKLGKGFKNILSNPNSFGVGRLIGNYINNNRVYDEALKAINPNKKISYNTYRQVFSDEGTRQGYYRRAALGETSAAKPVTSDMDRQIAYLMEAKRVGDELRAQGDLANNQEIRRTSDESNQHQWGNIQRGTEVYNYNRESENQANALRHNLLSQRHSAQWSSTDNFLQQLEYRSLERKKERDAIAQRIWELTEQNNLLNNPEYKALQKVYDDAYNDAIKNNRSPQADKAVREALQKLKEWQTKYRIGMYERMPISKSGSKIIRKKKDDLLYKSGRDTVEHFRKMSKIASDSYNRKQPKIEKLTSHPKGKTKSYLLGGVAPFTIYKPVALGGETTTTSSSKEESKKNEKLDMIKELFKAIQGQGLPIDVSQAYNEISYLLDRYSAFGEELSTDDIASMYLSSMKKINDLKYSKSVFDKAKELATSNEALNEYAVTTDGKLVLQDIETGQVNTGTYEDFVKGEGKLIPITNDLLLNLRAYSPQLASFRGDSMMQIINNGVGMNKIAKQIKELAVSIGSTELKIEGISLVESNKVKAGLKILAGTEGTPDGYYKVTTDTKDSTANINAALNYIYNMLPKNYKAILELHAGGDGKKLIASFLTSLTDDYVKLDISPLTGKAALDKNKDSDEKIKSNPLMLMILGEGGVPRTWELITKDSNVKMSVDGIEYSQLPKITEDMSLDKMLSESGIAGILDSKLGITFGDLNISPDLFKDVMYSNSGGMVVTLPCKIVNGHKEVNLGVKKTYEEAIQEVESKGLSKNSPEYYKVLGEVLKQKGLNSLLDSNGYPDRNKFGLFLVVEAYTTDKVKNLDTSSQYIEKVKNPDALLEERMIKALSTDSKKSNYNLDINYWLYGDNVYRGTVFIPLNNNLNAAINASGNLISVENARELENKFQNFNKASNMKSSNSDIL